MATKKTAAPFVGVDALKHSDDKRRNIPNAEYQSLMADEARKPVQVSYPRGTSNADGLQAEKNQRNRDHISREPEQVKAFRDTWRDGINSYLTYLREREWVGVCADWGRECAPRVGAHGRSIR